MQTKHSVFGAGVANLQHECHKRPRHADKHHGSRQGRKHKAEKHIRKGKAIGVWSQFAVCLSKRLGVSVLGGKSIAYMLQLAHVATVCDTQGLGVKRRGDRAGWGQGQLAESVLLHQGVQQGPG